MNKVDIFLNKLEELCNYNQKWIDLLLQDLTYKSEVVAKALSENLLILDKQRVGKIDEIDNHIVNEGYPITEKIIIILKNDGIKYKKITTANPSNNGIKKFSKTSTITITNDFEMNYYYNEHSNTTYLPWLKAKPANKIIDSTLEESYENGYILNSSTKKTVETIDPNIKNNSHEYDIIKTTYEPIPYEDPNRNTYVSVTTETSSLHNGIKNYNNENNWYQNLDFSRKTFMCGEKALDNAIKIPLIDKYILKRKCS